MRFNDRRGFTLIEVIVVAGIIAILAGILVPMIFNQIDESRKTRALADCKSIQTAILTFRKDTGVWPNRSNATTADVGILHGTGGLPTDSDLTSMNFSGTKHMYIDHLKADTNGTYGSQWKGPYLTDLSADPWGNSYITNAANFNDNPSTPVWILSAGPNGTLETPSNTSNLAGDDIGMLLK